MDFSTPIDLDHLQNICDNDPAFEQELLQIFIEDTQTHLTALNDAVSDQEPQTLREEAHHIKGASANVEAIVLQDLAHQLEEKGKQANLSGAKLIGADLSGVNLTEAKLQRSM